MAEPKVELNNPWAGLKGGKLKIDGDVPKLAQELVADLLDVIEAVSAKIPELQTFKGLPVQTIPSSGRLMNKYHTAGMDLETVLKDHRTVLQDMGEAFVAAGNTFKGSEADAKTAFDKLRGDRKAAATAGIDADPTNGGSVSWPTVDVNKNDKGRESYKQPAHLAKIEGARDTSSMDTEPPEFMDYVKSHGIYTETTASGTSYGLVRAFSIWTSVGTDLQTGFGTFNNRFTNLLGEKWVGQSADKAHEGVTAYKDNGGKLAAASQTMGANLKDMAGWWGKFLGGQSKYSILEPSTMSDSTKREVTEMAQQAFKDWYIPGVTTSSGAIPTMPPAMNPVKKISVPPPGSEPGRPGSPGQKLGPGGPGASPGPGVNQAALKKQQDALDKAQEQLRQQAQADQKKALEQQKADEQKARELQADYTKQQQDAQQRADDAAKKQQAMQAAQQAGDGINKAMQAAQQAMQQGIQDKAKEFAQTFPAGLDSALAAAKGLGSGPGPGKGAGPGPGPGSPLSRDALQAAKLFPRAAAAADGSALGRAGLAATAGAPGTPGGMGPAGHGAGQGGQKEHKRSDYLDSVEHLEEALGEAPVVAKPVVEK